MSSESSEHPLDLFHSLSLDKAASESRHLFSFRSTMLAPWYWPRFDEFSPVGSKEFGECFTIFARKTLFLAQMFFHGLNMKHQA